MHIPLEYKEVEEENFTRFNKSTRLARLDTKCMF
jgi:hypothetical protein